MKHFPRMIFGMIFVIVSMRLQSYSASAPVDVSSLATAKGYLVAGTFSGKVFASPDSGVHWSDVSNGLCDSSSLVIKCINVTKDDTIHAITACGEFVSTVPDLHWKQIFGDSCQAMYCPACITNMGYSARVNRWIITASSDGMIQWSQDSGKTWTVAVPGCLPCSMPIILGLYFDTISALAGLYEGYSVMIGYNSNIIMSTDSGRTWRATNFAPVDGGVRSITRIGSIAFAGTLNGIYASRDNFATWWLLGESSAVKKSNLPVRTMTVGNDRGTREFTLTGKLLRHAEYRHGNQVVIEVRADGTGRYFVKKTASKDFKR